METSPETPPARIADPIASALAAVETETRALAGLAAAFRDGPLGAAFARAVAAIVAARGRVIVSGVGKSGLIGRKVAATLACTGTPAMFLHPGDAGHGDLGMITRDDILLALSWSGETAEFGHVVTFCRRFGVPLLAATSRPDSTLGAQADLCLPLPRVREACPNGVAPTSSALVQLALGDALAVALVEQRGFSIEDFRTFHPGGKLREQLRTVGDLMGVGAAVPRVHAEADILDATVEMSRKRYGCAAVVDGDDRIVGAFTDGDLRRCISARRMDSRVGDQMTANPATVRPDTLASEALATMNARSILQLFVCEGDRLVGVIHVHDILRAGVA